MQIVRAFGTLGSRGPCFLCDFYPWQQKIRVAYILQYILAEGFFSHIQQLVIDGV